MTETSTGAEVHWGDIFFQLHKHCGLNKWEIWGYTLQQITELIKQVDKYIEYEVKLSSLPMQMFGSVGDGDDTPITDDGYTVATADDIDLFAQLLGGM